MVICTSRGKRKKGRRDDRFPEFFFLLLLTSEKGINVMGWRFDHL